MQTAAVFIDTIQNAAKHDSSLQAEQQAFVTLIISRGIPGALNIFPVLKSKPHPYAKTKVPHGNTPWEEPEREIKSLKLNDSLNTSSSH